MPTMPGHPPPPDKTKRYRVVDRHQDMSVTKVHGADLHYDDAHRLKEYVAAHRISKIVAVEQMPDGTGYTQWADPVVAAQVIVCAPITWTTEEATNAALLAARAAVANQAVQDNADAEAEPAFSGSIDDFAKLVMTPDELDALLDDEV